MPARLSVSVFALAFAACAFTQSASAMQEAGETAATTPASVIVFDQKLDSPEVRVSYIFAPEKSFAVIYGSDEKGPDTKKVLGELAVNPGDHRDLKVPLSGSAKSGDALWVALYRAKSGGAAFDGKGDVSYWAGESLPSMNSFLVR
jgi:hypothetical protein